MSRDEEDLKTLSKEKDRLQELGSGDRQLMQWKIKINAAVGTKEQNIKKLLVKKAKLEEQIGNGAKAGVTVTEQIFAGTILIIDGIALKITDDRKTYDKIVFKTDAKKEKVVAY